MNDNEHRSEMGKAAAEGKRWGDLVVALRRDIGRVVEVALEGGDWETLADEMAEGATNLQDVIAHESSFGQQCSRSRPGIRPRRPAADRSIPQM